MIPKLPRMKTPDWLAAIGRDTGAAPPLKGILKDVLTESLYYPACGLDGTPVKFFAGNVLSFVYADYEVTKDEYLRNLDGHDAGSGFRGYRSIVQREVFTNDIVPSGWRPLMTPSSPEQRERLRECEARCRPFGHWSVWQRSADFGESHGPDMFSVLYFAGEMSAIYQGLFCRLGIAPKILAIIQPGGGLGGGWENPDRDDSFFKKVVGSNRAGMPEYLLYGFWTLGTSYEPPCWSEYRGKRLAQLRRPRARLWKLNVPTDIFIADPPYDRS